MTRIEGSNSFQIQARNQQGGKGKIEVNPDGTAVSKNLRLADIRKALEPAGYTVVAGSLKQRPDGSWEMKVKTTGYKINIGRAIAQDKAERAQAKFAGALKRGELAAARKPGETVKAAIPESREIKARGTHTEQRAVSNEPKQPTSQPKPQPKSLASRAWNAVKDILPKPSQPPSYPPIESLPHKDFELDVPELPETKG